MRNNHVIYLMIDRIKQNIDSLISMEVENYVPLELTNDLARLHSSAKKWLDKTEIDK